jgi:hypothetical protein
VIPALGITRSKISEVDSGNTVVVCQ